MQQLKKGMVLESHLPLQACGWPKWKSKQSTEPFASTTSIWFEGKVTILIMLAIVTASLVPWSIKKQ